MKKLLILFIVVCPLFLNGQEKSHLLMKAKAMVQSGKPDDAINLLATVSINEADASIYLSRAEAYIASGDYSRAIDDFYSANKISPASGEYGLARIYALRGDAATSVYHLEQCLKSAFKKSEKDIMLDPSFSPVENKPEWRQFWKKEWYTKEEKGVSEIEYYISTGNIDEAKAIFSKLSGEYSGNPTTLYGGALINVASVRYGDAIKTLTSLLAEDADNEKYLRLLVKAQEASGNFAGASDTYYRIINSGVPDPELLVSRAECFRKTGEIDKAAEIIKEYLEIYPESVKGIGIAGRLESARGDNLKALEYFNSNVRLHPSHPQCYIDRGNSYFLSRSWDWAIKDYSMSLDLQPGNAEAWLNKGISLLNSGKVDDACFDFRMSLSLGYRKATEYISRHCIR
ncbi:MAG: tetratricopeptide repeat protein [Bacteroidales bacterium]|nr:tetratricopeptide repeat protein [Bacteroidales bacterium]